MDYKLLIQKALEAQKLSYSPYSHFCVGAALLGRNEVVYTGCNIENASYSPTNCAERTAFFKAISEGQKEFKAIAIVGSLHGAKAQKGGYTSPCGVCRQVMTEFCVAEEFEIILATSEEDYRIYTLDELFPVRFLL